MGDLHQEQEGVRFGIFELNARTGELRRNGVKIKLQEQPLQILSLLLERPGELLTREELRQKLWPDTHVDYEHSLNAAIKRLRESLDDCALNPRFVETVPRRGYRFIAPVETVGGNGASVSGAPRPSARMSLATRVIVPGVVGALVLAALLLWNLAGSRPGKADAGVESLAVLPLQNLSGDPSQDYLAAGTTDALITELGKISALRVISRQSIMQYQGTNKPVSVIAREMGVDAVLAGSVQRTGERMRISLQLVDPDDRQRWAESYEGEHGDILELQSQVARAVARAVSVSITPAEEARLARSRRVNPQAHEALLRGRYQAFQTLTADGVRRSIDYFQRAIELQPDYAEAYVSLAEAYEFLGTAGVSAARPREVMPKAKEAALKAIELDANLGEAHAALGLVLMEYEWDRAGAERSFQRALELNPGYTNTYIWYSQFLALTGETEEAVLFARRAVERDPVCLFANTNLAFILNVAGRREEAFAQSRRTLELNPNLWLPHSQMGWFYLEEGRADEALASLGRAVELSGESPHALSALGYVHARLGRRAEARRILEQLQARARTGYVSPLALALIHATLGEQEAAYPWLERAYQERSPELLWLKAKPESHLGELSREPRLQALLERVRFP